MSQIARTLVCITMVCSMIASAGSLQPFSQMPQFVFNRLIKLLFLQSDVWEAGMPDSFAILSSGSEMTLRIRLADNLSAGFRRILVFRCPNKSIDDHIDMDSLEATIVSEQCSGVGNMAFSIRKPQTITSSPLADDFTLTMSTSRVSYRDVLRRYLLLRIIIEYSNGETLQSNSLSVWNLDPLSDYPPCPPIVPAYSRRSFITQAGIEFLIGRSFGPGGLTSLQFIDPGIIAILSEAPKFFISKINLGAILNFDCGGCYNVQPSTMFTSYGSRFDRRHVLLQKLTRLNLQTGKLWYSKCRLTNEIYTLYESKFPSSIGLCLVTSVTGQMQPCYQVSQIRSILENATDFSYANCLTPSKMECDVVPDSKSDIAVYAGTGYASLVCPIICDDATIAYRFYINDRLLIPPITSDWDVDNDAGGVRIARSGNVIELDPANAQSGVYRCEAGSRSFNFSVRVITAPRFATSAAAPSSHPLPLKVFAVEGETMSYTCAVAYSGLQSVVLRPVFYLPSNVWNATSSHTAVSWTRHNLDSFEQLLGIAPSPLIVRLNSTANAYNRSILTLTTIVKSTPALVAKQRPIFGHRFVCESGVTSPDEVSNIFGFSSLSSSVSDLSWATQSRSDIVHLQRPNRDSFIADLESNSCSKQRCHLGLGATFKFGLSSNYAAYLKSSGVEIVAYLRLDSFLLTDVSALMRPNVSKLTVADASSYAITYEILPFDNSHSYSVEARGILENHTKLTSVFNFRYSNRGQMLGLSIDKSRYGRPLVSLGSLDCRADPLCFYSTAFDDSSPDGSLNFLNVALQFKSPSQHATVALAVASVSYFVAVIAVCTFVILFLAILLVYLAKRSPTGTYHLEEKEVSLGHKPKAEAREEKFKEFHRPESTSIPISGYANFAFSASTGQISYAALQSTRESDL